MSTILLSEQQVQFYKRPESEYQCPRCNARIKDWNGDDSTCGFYADGGFRENNWNCATLIALRYHKSTSTVRCDDYSVATIAEPDVGFGVLKWYKSRGKTDDFRDEWFEPGTLKLAQQLLGDICSDVEYEWSESASKNREGE